jgi:hypothetical protein
MDINDILRGLRATGRRRLAAFIRPHLHSALPAVLDSVQDLDIVGMYRLWRGCVADRCGFDITPMDLVSTEPAADYGGPPPLGDECWPWLARTQEGMADYLLSVVLAGSGTAPPADPRLTTAPSVMFPTRVTSWLPAPAWPVSSPRRGCWLATSCARGSAPTRSSGPARPP